MKNDRLKNKKLEYAFTDKVARLAVIYTLFILLLMLSGSLGGVFGEAVYYLAFLLPCALALPMLDGKSEENKSYLYINSEGIKTALPFFAPSVGVIVIMALLTSALIYAVSGQTNSIDVGDSLPLALINHAILPALLEELLFRYIPLRLLAPHSGKWTVLLSALFFGFAHHSLFRLPYALVAGVIFMTLDLMTDSVYPSVALHFINNTLSVLMIFFSSYLFYPVIAILSLISLIFIIRGRKNYFGKIKELFSGGEKFRSCPELFVFLLLSIGVTLLLG
jgi:membrane protease YdiL (CAAX protease family)